MGRIQVNEGAEIHESQIRYAAALKSVECRLRRDPAAGIEDLRVILATESAKIQQLREGPVRPKRQKLLEARKLWWDLAEGETLPWGTMADIKTVEFPCWDACLRILDLCAQGVTTPVIAHRIGFDPEQTRRILSYTVERILWDVHGQERELLHCWFFTRKGSCVGYGIDLDVEEATQLQIIHTGDPAAITSIIQYIRAQNPRPQHPFAGARLSSSKR